MNCLIIEDSQRSQEQITEYIKRYGGLEIVGVCADTSSAYKIMATQSVDLLFLDVELSRGENGLSFYESLSKKPHVIVVTSHLKYAVDSFAQHLDGFLHKPFRYNEFKNMVDHVFALAKKDWAAENIKNFDAEAKNFIPIILDNGEVQKLPFSEITYMEQLNRDIYIYTISKKQFIRKRTSLSELEEILPYLMFQRVNKCTIVNKMYTSIVLNSIEVSGKIFEISRHYLPKQTLKEK